MRRLITIPISHYCEKARWALERAGLEYREERHVQGIHQVVARRAGGGNTVPVLVAPDAVLTESEAIVRYADGHVPEERRLFPAEPRLLADVEALCRELDDGLGPDGRRVMYLHMLPHKALLLRFNNAGVPAWEAAALRALWPLAVRWARRELAMAPERLADDEARVHRAFDAVARRLEDGQPHLCGARFTAADLTFACLAASVVLPPEYGVRLPEPDELPESAARAVSEFRAHPAGAYALKLFRDHRPR